MLRVELTYTVVRKYRNTYGKGGIYKEFIEKLLRSSIADSVDMKQDVWLMNQVNCSFVLVE